MDTEQTPANEEEPRLPFDAQFVQFVEAFSKIILQSIPELHGIAIVPLWNNQPENMPPGLLQLRNPQPPYLPSLTLLLKRLAASLEGGMWLCPPPKTSQSGDLENVRH